LGGFGSQALSPILSDIKSVKTQIVPREEINYRAQVTERRLVSIEADIVRMERQRYDEMREELRDLKARQAR
jgi:hypothetical protein